MELLNSIIQFFTYKKLKSLKLKLVGIKHLTFTATVNAGHKSIAIEKKFDKNEFFSKLNENVDFAVIQLADLVKNIKIHVVSNDIRDYSVSFKVSGSNGLLDKYHSTFTYWNKTFTVFDMVKAYQEYEEWSSKRNQM